MTEEQIKRDLTKKSEVINSAKIKKATIEGRMQSSFDQLKKIGINDLDEAEEVLNLKRKERDKLLNMINEDYEKLNDEWR